MAEIDGHSQTHPTTMAMAVGVIGGGAWGTALAMHAARGGHPTTLWARETEVVESINQERENKVFLAGHKVPDNMKATGNLSECLDQSQLVLMVVPTQFVKGVMAGIAGEIREDHIFVCCAKGIHTETLETVNEIMESVMPENVHHRFAYLSGPSFAKDVAEGCYTAVTVAAKDENVAKQVQEQLSTPRFRCYRSTDVVGVELGGALKNVLAIACGICDGLKFGDNARAALITRGLSEITRLAVAKGANPLTLGGLSGMGDLVLTCTGDLSRNRTVGIKIGQGQKLSEILASTNTVAEGVYTCRAAYNLAKKEGVDVPIIEGIFKILNEDADPEEVVHKCMTRELKEEVAKEVMDAAAEAAMEAVG